MLKYLSAVYRVYLTLKSYVIIGAIIATLLTSSMNSVVFAPSRDLTEVERESGFYNEEGYELAQHNRPAINPDFAPDYSCLFDAFQLKCIPGSEQDCHEIGFGNNDDYTCFPLDENGDWTCPEGYHGTDDDETGQCYSNEGGCEYDNMVLLTDRPGLDDRCADLTYICGQDEYMKEDYCIEFCDENPERMVCRPEVS